MSSAKNLEFGNKLSVRSLVTIKKKIRAKIGI